MFVCKAWYHKASPSHNEVRTRVGISIAVCFRNVRMAKTAVGGRGTSSIAWQCNNLKWWRPVDCQHKESAHVVVVVLSWLNISKDCGHFGLKVLTAVAIKYQIIKVRRSPTLTLPTPPLSSSSSSLHHHLCHEHWSGRLSSTIPFSIVIHQIFKGTPWMPCLSESTSM